MINEIDLICKEYDIENYTINQDGSIDVDGGVNLNNKNLTKLPLKFNKVSGDFNCNDNQLTTLENGPTRLGGYFDCGNNQLTSLKGSPKEVGGDFFCAYNQLITLEGGPIEVYGNFYCNKDVNDIEPYITINIARNIVIIDYDRYRKANDRDKKINDILL